MISKFTHITGLVSELKSHNRDFSLPIKLEQGGFLICLKGSARIVVDMKQYQVNQYDIVVAFPYSVVQILNSDTEFDGAIMGVGIDFFANVQIQNKALYFTTVRTNPSISLTENEASKILSLYEQILQERQDSKHLFRNEIDEAFFSILLYKIAAIYDKRAPKVQQPSTRDDIIFNGFIFQLFNDYKRVRTLEYYAQLQHITPSYLSKVVKRASGRSASNWIIMYTINNIKQSLSDLSRPINMIADEYNFPNSSFFSQYFKKYVGMTPKDFRTSLTK